MSPGVLALLVAASVSALGCATRPPPATSARVSPDIVEPVRAGSPVLAARIVADERPIELHGEFTPNGRAAFEEARSARIANRPRSRINPPSEAQAGAHVVACVVSVVGIVACPLGLAIGSAVHGTVNGVRYIKAEAREPSLLVPEARAYSLAAMFRAGATGRALGERAALFTMPLQPTNGADAEPRIRVRMKTVETFQSRRNWLGIRVVAEAQAIPAAGIAPVPTEHVYAWTYGPLSGWTEQGDELVRQVLDQALDSLAGSIASTYMGSWEPMILAAETAAANRRRQEMASSNARKDIAPSSAAIAPAMDSSLPVAGDSWTYKLSESKGRHRQVRTHGVRIASVTQETIVEQYADEPGAPVRTLHRQGAYLIREGAVSLFSPYYTPSDAAASGAPIANIKNLDPASCGADWICSMSASVTGKEVVHVPAGQFEAIKVQVQHTRTGRYPGAANAATTLTIWYSTQTRRAVKFSSRSSGGSSFQGDFDLELESYFLN